MKVIAAMVAALLLCWCGLALAAAPPADGIHDPLEIWPPPARKNLADLRANILKDRGFSVYFVAIGVPESMSADRMAQEMLTEWLPAGEGAVLLTLVDRPGLGLAVTSGRKRPREEDLEQVRMYLYSNRKTDSSAAVLEAAANQLVSSIQVVAAPPAKATGGPSDWLFLHWFEIASIVGAVFLVALGIYLMRVAKHSNFFGFQKHFPTSRVKGRLGGANSGGYGVMIDFGNSQANPSRQGETEY